MMLKLTRRARLGVFLMAIAMNSAPLFAQIGPTKVICREAGEDLILVLEKSLTKWSARRALAASSDDFSEAFFKGKFGYLKKHFENISRPVAHSVFDLSEKEFSEITEKVLTEALQELRSRSANEVRRLFENGIEFATTSFKNIRITPNRATQDGRIILRVEIDGTAGRLSHGAHEVAFSHISYVIRSTANKFMGDVITSFPSSSYAGVLLPFLSVSTIPGNSTLERENRLLHTYPTMLDRLAEISDQVVLSIVDEALRFRVEYEILQAENQKQVPWTDYVIGFVFQILADPFLTLDNGGMGHSTVAHVTRMEGARICHEATQNENLSKWLAQMGIIGAQAAELRQSLWNEIIAPRIDGAMPFELSHDYRHLTTLETPSRGF